MRIDIITVVPELLVSPLNESILKRAQQKGLVEIAVHNLRDYTFDRYRQVDDYPFGGEAGMVMKPEPIFRCIEQLQSERTYDEVIYTSPDGIRYNQHEANRLSTLGNIVILCGHYKGIDYRVREHLITLEISIGDGRRAGRGDYRRQRGTRDSGRDRRRSFGTDGQFSGQPARSAGLHAPGRFPRLESAGCPAVGQSERDRQMAGGAGFRTHGKASARPARSAIGLNAPRRDRGNHSSGAGTGLTRT